MGMATMGRGTFVLALMLAGCGPSQSAGGGDGGGGGAADAAPQPVCDPGETRACYTGWPGTEGVGVCRGGTITCDERGFWGFCDGEVTPRAEICGNDLDDNCNGVVDEEQDLDGDGFTNCDGDCCDSVAEGCASPELVNPGAFEVAGNDVDDDCDGVIDNEVVAACDDGLASNATDPLDYARAMDLCQTATEAADDRRWGVISARFTRADGNDTPDAVQRAIRTAFGASTVRHGNSMVVLSSGHAAATGQMNPAFAAFQPGTSTTNTSGFPADWLAANGGTLPNAPGCPAPLGSTANDPVLLELRVRTPTNARSFSLATNFLSAEYPEYTCSAYNDFFVVLLDSSWSGTPANPADKNLAIYRSPANDVYPVGVNLAHGNTGLFTVCENGATGCALGATAGTINTCVSTAELVGTGFDGTATGPFSKCGDNDLIGGGTGWLTTSGNVAGGEIITLRIALWDTSDHRLDSVALIDYFRWSVEASEPGTIIVD
ncbi:MAG TPA: choice-of-anchor L domain-containing protein [Kofleriaceae bacterium]|nr:choice-of-anchor L domain-containing protein [Kofleriaceae bacterium]